MGLFNKKVHPTRKKVTDWAKELKLTELDSDGSFVGMKGSAIAKIRISEIDEETGVVSLSAQILQDVPNKSGVLDELFFGVGTEKHDLLFWDVMKDDDGTLNIFLKLRLLDINDNLKVEEFCLALGLLVQGADDIDDKLQKKIGGNRAEDWLNTP
jgi:hypothetical protein